MRSDHMSVSGTEEVQLDKDTLLDEALDALYEKRYAFVSFSFTDAIRLIWDVLFYAMLCFVFEDRLIFTFYFNVDWMQGIHKRESFVINHWGLQ